MTVNERFQTALQKSALYDSYRESFGSLQVNNEIDEARKVLDAPCTALLDMGIEACSKDPAAEKLRELDGIVVEHATKISKKGLAGVVTRSVTDLIGKGFVAPAIAMSVALDLMAATRVPVQ